MRLRFAQVALPSFAVLCLFPQVTSAEALVAGLLLSITLGNPYTEWTKSWVPRLLALSVAGLGAGMNLFKVAQVGLSGFGYTLASISFVLSFGFLLGKLLKVELVPSLLISVGTAICGGSAIAAIAPLIRAKNHEISVALGIVFLLNSVALVIFPWLGHEIGLSQGQFGLWSALAIHDTSSVVGANLQYGAEALQIGTTVKLARALWIVPVSFFVAYIYNRKNPGLASQAKPKRPWFILGFLLMATLATASQSHQLMVSEGFFYAVDFSAKRLFVLVLFLIGTNLSLDNLKKMGPRAFAHGFALWVLAAAFSFVVVVF